METAWRSVSNNSRGAPPVSAALWSTDEGQKGFNAAHGLMTQWWGVWAGPVSFIALPYFCMPLRHRGLGHLIPWR
jgi:hypothetical protein